MLKPLKLSEYYGHNYDEYVGAKFYIACMKTGKSGKKSSTIARKIVMRAIASQRFCAVVARKVGLDHEKSTIPAIVKAFNKVQALTGYEWRKYWTVNKGAKNPNIINEVTGQIIRFVSFDRPESMAGLELDDEQLDYEYIWFEEPMQVSDKKENFKDTATRQKREEQEFDIIVSSAFRGKLPEGGHREIAFSFNDWSDGDYWIINKYVKPYINEDVEILDKKGKQLHYDPNFMDGKGILVMVASGGINEWNDEDYIKFATEIKHNDYEFYKAIWLGAAAQIVGNAYSAANIKMINLEKKPEAVEEWLIGIDYSSTKDYIAMYLEGTNANQELHVIDCFRYHRGKEKDPMPEPVLIKHMWQKIEKWHKEYEFSTSHLRVEVRIDSRDSTMRSYLQKHWGEANKVFRFDIEEPAAAAKFRSASSFVRVMALRYIMGDGKLFINPELTSLIDNIKARTIFKDGSIKDGGDDDVQAVEYGYSHKIEDMLPAVVYHNILETYGGIIQKRRDNE